MINQQLKSRTIRFNAAMGVIDMLVANAALLGNLLSDKQFAITLLVLKGVQVVGNIYLRNITTKPVKDL